MEAGGICAGTSPTASPTPKRSGRSGKPGLACSIRPGILCPPQPPSATNSPPCFAFLGRKLGVDKLGLFWPEWNHVVAVWSVTQGETTHRIVVPTSQIFLDANASLGTKGFNPWKQKTIYTYRRKDMSDRSSLPMTLAKTLIDQAWLHAFEDPATAQKHRNARSRALGGS